MTSFDSRTDRAPRKKAGGGATVYLVGAGPGDPGLLTRRAARLLRRADIVVHDALVGESILALIPDTTVTIDVGKRRGGACTSQDRINEILVDCARTARVVVRLKGGDPFVFGRGGEEALALAAAGVRFEVVPGVTAGIGVPAYAGIPVTHRAVSSSVTFVTGHRDPGDGNGLDWDALARLAGTLVIYMGVGTLESTAARLVQAGRSADTPAAIIEWGTHGRQRTVTASLSRIADAARAAGLGAPALVVIGEVAALREELAWYDRRSLNGKRVLVGRTRAQPSRIAAALRRAGADVLEYPNLRALSTDQPDDVDRAIASLREYDWLVFTSPAAVIHFWRELAARDLDTRATAGLRVAAFGKATIDALEARGIRPDLAARTFAPSVVAERMAAMKPMSRILFPREAHLSSPIAHRLREVGAEVDEVAVFRVVVGSPHPSRIDLDDLDAIVLPSSSAARTLADLIPLTPTRPKIVTIGPVTAQTALASGLPVDGIAERHTVEGVLNTVRDVLRPRMDSVSRDRRGSALVATSLDVG